MRDPDLVHRAERAAIALERAWGRWRAMHGLGSDPLPPVSSYVGYSLEEPWGQPRVVFGVDANEAERLAALLDGHDCVGPIHAEVTGRPDWLRGPGGSGTPARPSADQLSIPLQAPPPGSDMFLSASEPDRAAGIDAGATHPADPSAEAVPSVMASSDAMEADIIDAHGSGSGPAADSAMNDRARSGPAGARPADDSMSPPTPGLASSRSDDADHPAEAQQLSDQADAPGAAQLPEIVKPGIVALRRRAGRPQEAEPQEAEPQEAAPMTSGHDITANQGPGYRGPRYQGYPPQYHDAPDFDHPLTEYAAAPVADSDDVSAPASKPQRGKARQVSRLGRTRRPGPGAHESWGSAGDQAADHAV
jgi:hypothetical protein